LQNSSHSHACRFRSNALGGTDPKIRTETPEPNARARAFALGQSQSEKKQDTAQSASHYGKSAGLTANKHGQRQAALLQAEVV